MQGQWYGLFILSTELDDVRLMRLRLERLLCWRESPERWSSYQHMLPVFILARSQRQCDHWLCRVYRVGPQPGNKNRTQRNENREEIRQVTL
jgi:hypothetical protein